MRAKWRRYVTMLSSGGVGEAGSVGVLSRGDAATSLGAMLRVSKHSGVQGVESVPGRNVRGQTERGDPKAVPEGVRVAQGGPSHESKPYYAGTGVSVGADRLPLARRRRCGVRKAVCAGVRR